MKHFICDFKIWVTLLLNLIIRTAHAGHEVLYKFASSQPALEIQPEELLVIQYDSRPLSSYWNTTARWNKAFCDRFGHRYLYLSVYNRNLSCSISSRGAGIGTNLPTAPGSILLAEPWCKVKAMMIADRIFADSSTKAFLFMDSDALITVRNYSMTTVLNFLQQDLGWDMIHQPFAFNQDGPGWACKFTTSLRIGYQLCLNSGTVFWRRNALSTAILTDWWRSAGAPYTSNRFPPKWRLRWPWEQAQMYEVYLRHSAHIRVLTFENMTHLPWTSRKNPKSQYPTDAVEPYCFSHWPGANCFITHYCASKNQKLKMMREFDLPSRHDISVPTLYIDTVDAGSYT